MRKTLILFLFFILCGQILSAQEVTARIKVMDNQLPTTVDKRIFRTLESSLNNFINKRKWTKDSYKMNEKIECQFLLNLKSMVELNVYEANLTIQSARPIYQSSYLSPIINYQDVNFTFKYIEGQPIEYAPDAPQISGWKSYENNNRNRYWLTENLINNRYALIHDFYYNYYRKGLDKMYENETEARQELLNALMILDNLNRETPNLMIIQFFMLGKSAEIIGIFKKADGATKARVLEMLVKLDVSNANKYKQELK